MVAATEFCCGRRFRRVTYCIVFGLFLKIIDVFEFFILLFQNKSPYLQCTTF